MSAKFIAQIEMSKLFVRSDNSPADATRPRIVSSSGSPAATSEPKASTMIAIVTGQERSSDFIIAALLAVLKSLQMPGDPVTETATDGRAVGFQLRLELVGGSDHRGRVALRTGRHDRGVPIRRDARARTWPLYGGDALVPGETALDAEDRPLELGRGGRHRRGVQNNGQRGARLPGEASLDQRPCLHRLRAVRLPAGARKRRLDPRREGGERDGDDRPHGQDRARVIGGEAAEPADRADSTMLAVRHRAGTSRCGDRRHLQRLSIPIKPRLAAERGPRTDWTRGTCW